MNLGLLRVVKMSNIECDLDARARKSYGVLADLARNIAEHGLMHPIVLYSSNGEPPYQLIAGARRFVACSQVLKWEEISCRIYDTPLTQQQLKAIELYENVMRQNLTPLEEAELRTQLHETMAKMAGVKTTSSPGHSITDTAELLGVERKAISRDIKLAKAARAHPELKLDEEKTKAAALRKVEIFAPRSPQNLTRDEWTAYVQSGQQWGTNARASFLRIAQQIVTRASQDATREELRELVKLLNVSIGA